MTLTDVEQLRSLPKVVMIFRNSLQASMTSHAIHIDSFSGMVHLRSHGVQPLSCYISRDLMQGSKVQEYCWAEARRLHKNKKIVMSY